MIFRTVVGLGFTMFCAHAQVNCLPVEGDQILVGDLARTAPAFAAVSPTIPIAPSPLPGGTRVFSSAELQALGSRFSVRVGATADICFRLNTGPLSRESVLVAMRDALQIPDAEVQLVEMSPFPVPHGRVEFLRERLSTPPSATQNIPVLWRGDVVYAGSRRYAIWAKVRITAATTRATAIENLKPGMTINSGQFRIEQVDAFPPLKPRIAVDKISGLVVRRLVPIGAQITNDDLAVPSDVARGDAVHIEVKIGGAHLAFSARAESAGRVGELITVRNPESKRAFSARVQGKDTAVVELGGAGLSQ